MLPSLLMRAADSETGVNSPPLTAWLPLSVLPVIVTVEPERTMMPPPWPRPAKLNALSVAPPTARLPVRVLSLMVKFAEMMEPCELEGA